MDKSRAAGGGAGYEVATGIYNRAVYRAVAERKQDYSSYCSSTTVAVATVRIVRDKHKNETYTI